MLHTLSHAESQINQENLLALIGQQDAVLLWQDGVTIGVKETYLLKQLLDKNIPIYALLNDIEARGLHPIFDEKIEQIDMASCIKLTEEYYPQLAW